MAKRPEEKKAFQEAASGQQHLYEMLDMLESTVLDLVKERDQLRKKIEELGRQSSTRRPRRSTRRRTGKKPSRSSAKQERRKKSDPAETPAAKSSASSDESKTPTGTRNALGRTLAQLRVNRTAGDSGIKPKNSIPG